MSATTPLRKEFLDQHDAEQAKQGNLPLPPLNRSEECIVSIPSESDYDETHGTKIYTSQTALLPACASHPLPNKGKAKETSGTILSNLFNANCSADGSSACTHAKLTGTPLPNPPTRFPLETPTDDLKVWLFFPLLAGRTGSLLSHPKFGAGDLRTILRLALAEIVWLHIEIDALVAYAARGQSCLRIQDPAPKANLAYYDMRPQHVEGVARRELEGMVLEAGREVDYLRFALGELKGRVLGE